MSIRFNPNPTVAPASDHSIAELEQLIAARLPDDYRAYLKHHHGEVPEPCDYRVPHTDDPWVDTIHEMNTVQKIITQMEDEFAIREMDEMDRPMHMIPIARNGCGDEVYLSLRQGEIGTIYHNFHEESDPDDRDTGLYRVGASFTAWLESLRNLSEDS